VTSKQEEQMPENSTVDEVPDPSPPPQGEYPGGLTKGDILAVKRPLDERIRKMEKQLADAQKEAADAQDEAAAAKEELAQLKRAHEEEVDRRGLAAAEAFAASLGFGATAEIAQAVHQLRKTNPQAAVKMEFALRRSSETARYSRLLQELGLDGEVHLNGSATAEAEALATVLRKSQQDLTKEQAIAQVFEDEPALYRRVLKEEAEGLA
jgi:hypothetical protein